MDNKNYVPKLPHAPLREVVFELKWLLGVIKEGMIPFDVGYPLAVGRFHDKILAKIGFEKYIEKNLGISNQHIPQIIRHQFWEKEIGVLPVVQFGPGILAVNDSGENYVWSDSYIVLIKDCLDVLKESYDTNKNIDKVKLQYINAIEIPENTEIRKFIKDTVRTDVQTLYEFPFEVEPANIQITSEYVLADKSILSMTISIFPDQKLNKLFLMFKNTVTNANIRKLSEIPLWLETAHETTSTLFRTMINEKFYEQFRTTK